MAAAAASGGPAAVARALVHRCTFMPWNPHSVACVAYAPSGTCVAVARSDGDVELWNCAEPQWFLEGVISGAREHPFRRVAWSRGRLFGASLGGDIVEFDPLALGIRQRVNSHGGAIWDLQVSPADPALLAAACEDGRVRIFRVHADDPDADAAGELQFLRACGGTKNGERLLSVCWHGDGEVLFCGGADSQIRCVAAQSGHTLFSMTVENYGQEPTLVWSVAVLADFTVVSGDSLGHVQIWDGGIGTLRQSFAMHEADVLCVRVSADEQHIYATGVDSKIVRFSSVDDAATLGGGVGAMGKKWVSTKARRYHTHDVVSMEVVRDPRSGDELIVAGGVDTQLSYMWAKNFAAERGHRVHKFLPFRQDAVCCTATARAPAVTGDDAAAAAAPVSAAPQPLRLVALTQHQTVNIWALGRPKPSPPAELAGLRDHAQLELEGGHRHVFKIQVATGGRNIQCSALANNGRWFACATAFGGIKLFRLRHGGDFDDSDSDDDYDGDGDSDDDFDDGGRGAGGRSPSVQRVRVPADVVPRDAHVHRLCFSADSSQLLLVTSDCQLVFVQLPRSASSSAGGGGAALSPVQSPGSGSSGSGAVAAAAAPRRVATVDARLRLTDSGGATLARTASRIKYVDWSHDGRWVAVAHSTNRVVVHPHPRHGAAGAEPVTLPAPGAPVTALAFKPSASPTILGVAHASNEVVLFDVDAAQLTPWSRAWRRDRLPTSVRRETHAITGLSFNFPGDATAAAAAAAAQAGSAALASSDSRSPAKKKGRGRAGKQNKSAAAATDAAAPADVAATAFIGYGTEAVFFINSAVFPSQHQASVAGAVAAAAAASAAGRKRRKADGGGGGGGAAATAPGVRAFKRSKKFKPAMFLQFIGPNEIVAVQVPWARISKQFVLPLHRKRYGS